MRVGRKFRLIAVPYVTALTFLVTGCTANVDKTQEQGAVSYVYENKVNIPALDDRQITYFVDRPEGEVKVPLLLVVDGSSCIGQLRPSIRTEFRPSAESPKPYARVTIEKPGVEHDADYPSPCSEDFLKTYSMDQSVFAHLRVLQHMKTHAEWWNGELYIWGWSDGGDIASRITAYYPNVTRAALGAMGGGYTMQEHFEDFWVCSEERAGEKRNACIEKLRAQFGEMRDNPTGTKTWSGPDNSWKVWDSRLYARLSNVLADNETPILIIQGEKDFDSTPAESARKLVRDLEAAGNTAFTYWEIPDMEHGWGKLPDAQKAAFEDAMLNWLLGVPVGAGGPPDFGAQLAAPSEP